MTQLYVNLGYSNPTKMAVLSGNHLVDVHTLIPQTEFEVIINTAIMLCQKYDIRPSNIVTRDPVVIAELKRKLGVD